MYDMVVNQEPESNHEEIAEYASQGLMKIDRFDFGEILKIVTGNPQQPQVFVGSLSSKSGLHVRFDNVVHLNTARKSKHVVFVLENDESEYFDLPTGVEISNWMDMISTHQIKAILS